MPGKREIDKPRTARKRSGGRQPGSRNKLTLKTREELWAYARKQGTSPFMVLFDLMTEFKTTDPKLSLDAAKALAPYMSPQLARQEVELGEETRNVIRFRYGKPGS